MDVMTMARRLLSLVVVGLGLAFPESADAQVPVPLTVPLGSPAFDPSLATVRVTPPSGGAVMLYRNGVAHGWFMKNGLTTVEPGQVYGVLATRGKDVLFHGGVLMRQGITDLAWSTERVPAMSFTPSAYVYTNHYAHGPHFDAPVNAIGGSRYRSLIRRMHAAEDERSKLAVLQAYARRYEFSRAQADGAIAEFHSRLYRRRAAQALSGRILSDHAEAEAGY
jgi:hypothetical protein